MRKAISVLALVVVLSLGVFAAFALANDGKPKPGKGNENHPTSTDSKGGDKGGSDHVTICHATGTPDNAGNGYVQISPSASGVYHGHYLQHDADIIPPFEYQGKTYSKNWDAPHIAIWKNGCKPVSTPTTTATTPTTTTTATTTTAPTKTTTVTTPTKTVTQPTQTVTTTKTVTVPKTVVKKKVIVKKVVVKKKVYLPTPPKKTTVKPSAFPYTL